MKLKQAIADKKFDIRTLEKLRANQSISEKEFKDYFSSIEDDSGNTDYVDVNRPDPAYPHITGPVVDENGKIIEDSGSSIEEEVEEETPAPVAETPQPTEPHGHGF